MSKSIIVILIVILISIPAHSPCRVQQQLIVWDVGQGQWVTVINEHQCLHFDMGGERMPLNSVESHCQGKQHRLYLSHGDWDHLNLIGRAFRRLRNLCLASPMPQNLSAAKIHIVKRLPTCPPISEGSLVVPLLTTQEINNAKSSNSKSQVYLVSNRLIVAGDSPSSQEKIWARRIKGSNSIKWLVAGHHGSNTSTSKTLLKYLPHLRLTIISARKNKYGHPHAEVIKRLADKKIPIIQTELWGNIHIYW